jgi:hypothetical protein
MTMAGDDDANLETRHKTFRAFLRLVGYSTAAIAVVLALMALFLT